MKKFRPGTGNAARPGSTHGDSGTTNQRTKTGGKISGMIKAAGLDSVWIDKVGNVIGLRKGKTGKKTVVR